ncbi:MAG: hypothetical protein ABIT36_07300 [Steroidobacteraceae bacterium]
MELPIVGLCARWNEYPFVDQPLHLLRLGSTGAAEVGEPEYHMLFDNETFRVYVAVNH